MQLPKLNFEQEFDFKIKQDKDTFFIYDPVRKIWLLLTPEEWVRQHWLQYFHKVKKNSFSSLILEKKIILNGATKRIDLLVTEKTEPKILIECKAPNLKLTQNHFEQIARYNSLVAAKEIILSNGLHHIFADYKNGEYSFRDEK